MYTCPAGHTAILKDVRLVPAGGAITQAVLYIGSGPDIHYIFNQSIAAGATPSMTPWIVLAPGDTIKATTDHAAGVRVWLSGTELIGVA
jgi:hypothetical protein